MSQDFRVPHQAFQDVERGGTFLQGSVLPAQLINSTRLKARTLGMFIRQCDFHARRTQSSAAGASAEGHERRSAAAPSSAAFMKNQR